VTTRSALVIVPLALCIGIVSQEPTAKPHVAAHRPNLCGGKHLPGDELKCYVTFKRPTNLTMVSMSFNILNANAGNLVLSDTQKVSTDTYEVTGVIPEHVQPGTYKLAGVSAGLGKANRSYQFGYGLNDDLEIEVQGPTLAIPPLNVTNRDPTTELQGQLVATPQQVQGPSLAIPPPSVANRDPQIEVQSQPVATPQPDAMRVAQTSVVTAPANPAIVDDITPHPIDITSIEGCVGNYTPGDTVTCYVRFSEDTDFKSLSAVLDMDMQDRAVPYDRRPLDQRLLCSGWIAEEFQKVDERTYKVWGVLPSCATGNYRLTQVTVVRPCRRGANCWSTQSLEPRIRNSSGFDLRNDNQKVFPELKKVSPFPPSGRVGHSSSK
jgi:hypothetical protein